MNDRDTPRGREELRRGVEALIEDKLAELERLQRRPALDEIRHGLTGMAFEILDSVRYRLQEFALLRGRTALPDAETAVVASLAREMIVTAVEREREDERARARELADRATPPVPPRGAFARPARLPPVPPPSGARKPGQAGGTVPGMPSAPPPPPPHAAQVDPHERVTRPAPEPPPLPRRPYRGQPVKPGQAAPAPPFLDDDQTPDGLEVGRAPRPPGRR